MDSTILIEAAHAASARSYAPYSNFRVGAALLTANGEIRAGCNVENASYGLSMCAERAAVFAMFANAVAEDDRKIRSVAVVSPDAAPCLPCGACRQVLREFGCEEVLVEEGLIVRRYPFEELFPHAFGPEAL
ncbi:MAG TPA: cytidine deaminase [Rubrobacteraceae bacterium]|nr:cytidine deaminase [Rubrobacteraceae bacterium]